MVHSRTSPSSIPPPFRFASAPVATSKLTYARVLVRMSAPSSLPAPCAFAVAVAVGRRARSIPKRGVRRSKKPTSRWMLDMAYERRARVDCEADWCEGEESGRAEMSEAVGEAGSGSLFEVRPRAGRA